MAPTINHQGNVARTPLVHSLEEIYWRGIERPQAKVERLTSQVIEFRASNEFYGMEIRCVRGVTRFPRLVHIPGASSVFLGAMTFRGKVVPVANFASIVGLPNPEWGGEARAIIASDGEDQFALAVDEVLGIGDIALGDVQPPPATLTGTARAVVRGQVKRDGRLVILLDVGAITQFFCGESEEVAGGS